MLANKPTTITDEGLKKIIEELNYLKNTKRGEVLETLARARALGDLSENSEYDEAREEQGKVESKIKEYEELLKNVKVISDIDTETVNVGAHIKVHNETYDEDEEYDIVGTTETDPINNKISDLSPIGKALIGAKAGETVNVVTPGGDMHIKVIEITKV